MSNLNEKLREFLEKKPLYSWQDLELPEYDTEFTKLATKLANELYTGFADLSQIEMECPNCKQSRPFGREKIVLRHNYDPDIEYVVTKVTSTIYPFVFKCHTCSSEYSFFIEVDIEKCKIKKVGQNPSWLSTNNNKDIDKFLKDDAVFFKKALACQSQGYGTGAFSYYRKVLENSIEKILNNIRSFIEKEDSSSDKINQIDEALKATIMDEKIKIAKDAIPESLKQNGINPLGTIYKTLSIGIHKLSEEECLENCEDIQIALSYLIQKLPQQNEEQKTYIGTLKRLNEFNNEFNNKSS